LIALRCGGDLTAARIGEILGMPTNAVEVALHRALVHLRERVDAQRAPDASAAVPGTASAGRKNIGRKGLGASGRIPVDTATESREDTT
jgi:Sigma-70, region 4